MVTGIESFKEWFKGNESQYAIIGGTACDILMTEEGLDFRATKDIDLVLIIEAVDAAFGRKFWDYGECYKNKYEPLDLSCVESHLKKYVKEKDLQAYNAALPSEEEINDYSGVAGSKWSGGRKRPSV